MILLGNGDGTFQPPKILTITNLADGFAAAAADFNGDGILDLAINTYDSASLLDQVSVMLGNGDGTFQAPSGAYKIGSGPTVFAAADFNGDGKFDLVTTGYNGGVISVLLGNGDGTFQPAVNYPAGTGSQQHRHRRFQRRWISRSGSGDCESQRCVGQLSDLPE